MQLKIGTRYGATRAHVLVLSRAKFLNEVSLLRPISAELKGWSLEHELKREKQRYKGYSGQNKRAGKNHRGIRCPFLG